MEEKRKEKEEYTSKFLDPNPPKRQIRFFNDHGLPLNINQANVEFSLDEDDDKGEYILDVACYKYLGKRKLWRLLFFFVLNIFQFSTK